MSSLINADKPVNIQLVLINPGKGWTPRFDFSRFEDADAASGDSGSTASAPRSSSRGRGRSSSSGSGFGNSDSGGMLRGGNANFAMEDDDVQVDIYGIIPLFNPPAPKRFPEIEQANEPEDEAAEEAAEEAASTATADGQSATSESGKDNSGTESGNSNSP